MVALTRSEHAACQAHIDAARGFLYDEVAALVAESYSRAYVVVCKLQRLAELEEVLAHRVSPQAFPITHLSALWEGRLGQLRRSVDTWQPLLVVHWLAAPPKENVGPSLRFAHIRRRSG